MTKTDEAQGGVTVRKVTRRRKRAPGQGKTQRAEDGKGQRGKRERGGDRSGREGGKQGGMEGGREGSRKGRREGGRAVPCRMLRPCPEFFHDAGAP